MRERVLNYLTKLVTITIIIVMCMNLVPVQAASKNMWLKKYYITVNVGKTSTIGIKSNTTGKNVTYVSSNKEIATVSSDGVIKGVKAGKVTITVKAGNVSRKCIVTVKNSWVAVRDIDFRLDVVALDIGETRNNQATVSPSNASSKWVTYSSGDNSIATVDSNGMITGIREGYTIITAKGSGGVKGVAEVYVSEYEYEELVNKKPDVYDSALIVKQGKIELGINKTELINTFGEPSMILDSEFNCPVYIYNNDYSSLVLVYVKNDAIIGYFTNASQFEACGIKSTFTRGEIYKVALGYSSCRTSKYINKMWYDSNNEITSILVMIPSIDPDELTTSYLPTVESVVISNLEIIYLELINGFRGRKGISPVRFDDGMSKVSRSHSEDMTKRNYFSHDTPEGLTPFDRLSNAGISYTAAGEILTGDMCLSTLYNISSFVGSSNHYKIIMNPNYTNAGPGVSMGNIESEEFGNITILFR